MDSFLMNGYRWRVARVHPASGLLVDRTGTRRVATTSPDDLCVYLSASLYGDDLATVLVHELGHCALFSYGLLDELHAMAYPDRWVDIEEWVCNILADYGAKVFQIAYNIVGYDAWRVVPVELDRLIAA